MNEQPATLTAAENNLHRKSTGLQPGHKGLIKLLAEIAVTDYLAEVAKEDAK